MKKKILYWLQPEVDHDVVTIKTSIHIAWRINQFSVRCLLSSRARRVQHFLGPDPIGSGSTRRALLSTETYDLRLYTRSSVRWIKKIYSKVSINGHLYNKGNSPIWAPDGTTEQFLLDISLYNKGTSLPLKMGTIFLDVLYNWTSLRWARTVTILIISLSFFLSSFFVVLWIREKSFLQLDKENNSFIQF
jgi:hypothetical protein